MNQKKKTIFISYGRDKENPKDIKLVKRVKNDLQNAGFEVLIDEEQLRGGSDWEIKLENMIKESKWILFFITPYSARRPEGFCLNELAMSIAYKKPIVPIMVNYEVPPLSICRLQYLDLQTLKKDEDYHTKLQEILSVIGGEKELGFEGEHLRTLSELTPIKFETTIAKHIYGFKGREWINNEVSQWLNKAENSRVLWIQAEAGFGKSAISTYLSERHPNAMSVYFCQYDYIESKDPREMLKVLIYELSTQIDEYHKVLQTLDLKEITKKSAEHIFTQLLLEPLQTIDKREKKRFFIIDALDEADNEGSNRIVELISKRFLDLPSWLNIVITSRLEPELLSKLKKFNPLELKADDQRNKKDLELFLRGRPEKDILDKDIINALIEKSEGNILYLKSIFELEMIKNVEITLENIQLLPPGMEGFYLTYFERKFENVKLYEDKYLEFVSLLVSQRGMPELLIKDILNLRDREYKEIKSNFGSLLIVNNNNLNFYHQTIYEWLSDYDKSGKYSADLELGINIFEEFIDNLTLSSYKEEYLDFHSFNQNIIDKIYAENGNLKDYFVLLSAVTNDMKKIETLISLGHYYSHNNILISIEMLEETLEITKKLYNQNSDLWSTYYTTVLNVLALNYQDNIDKVIELYKEGLEVSRSLYEKYSERGVQSYTITLNNLASFYKKNHKALEAIELEKRSLKILEKLYQDNKEPWVIESYTRALNNLAGSYKNNKEIPKSKSIVLLEQSFNILKEYYKIKPNIWVMQYTTALNNLAFLYAENNKVSDAIELWEESLPVLKELSIKSSKLYMARYVELLVRLSVSCFHIGNKPEAKKYAKNVLPKLEMLYQDNKSQWSEYYFKIKNNILGMNKQEKTKNKIKRNDLCPCGSKKKYKKCCGKN